MKLIGLLLLIIGSAFASSVQYFAEEDVIVLAPANYGNFLEDFNYVLVYFYGSDWEPKGTLASEYELASHQAITQYPGVKFGKIDAKAHKDYADMYSISELLSIKFFGKNKQEDPIEYTGEDQAGDILDFIAREIEKTVIRFETISELDGILSDQVNVGFYYGSPLSNAYFEFLGAASNFNDITFVTTPNDHVKKLLEIDDDTFILFRNKLEETNTFKGTFTVQGLQTFIETYKFPAAMHFDAAATKRLFEGHKNAVFFIGSKSNKNSDEEKAFLEIAGDFRDKIAFSLGYFEEAYGNKLAEYLGVQKDDLPIVHIIHADDHNRKYRLTTDINYRNLGCFLLNFYQNNLRPYYKSSPVPENDYEGDVRVVVSKTFKDIIFDEENDVLIEFYSPKCKRCQAFAPIYSGIATKLKDVRGLIIAKIDGSANDVEGVDLPGFPAVRLYPRQKKDSPIDYTGDTLEKPLMEFLQQHTTAILNN